MINQQAGGPAFPFVYIDRTDPGVDRLQVYSGMTLRDWFAGCALQGARANRSLDSSDRARAAADAYAYADAMLKARQQ